ncbi:hypothetical protein N473_08455 [Pseudoalteromonas luteoviolacea CPMOR-1]|uniref:N-acetyltransferase domain-containing protein n=1 Tax=Pseudoalteromonas luteoviolacea CPMOR-1 TaxID=1365248 RepID=A0A162B4E5_9GAMM|nr:GNAT family N-acetyltransferase [Pseudoalteromonas luteoviolacea]KZN66411.1 hypothetical protein N473_08455 [Pseudoalteromonas luteoviolacea CPMOR-1]
MSIEVRKANFDDFSAFKMLWQFYQYHQSSFSLEDIDEQGKFYIDESYLEEVLRGQDECNAYIVLSEQLIVGFVTVEPTEIMGEEMPELSDIFILPKYRNQGIAQLVIELLMHTKEYNEWHVAVYRNDKNALSFWEKHFKQSNYSGVKKVKTSDSEEFHEFVVQNA